MEILYKKDRFRIVFKKAGSMRSMILVNEIGQHMLFGARHCMMKQSNWSITIRKVNQICKQSIKNKVKL